METKMKISKETITILKNFASINSNLLIKSGSLLSTMNVQKNVLADAVVAEKFPIDFGIYDTGDFLGLLGLFSDPEIEFKDKYATIREGTSSIKFYSADPSVLTAPSKQVKFPASFVDFELTAEVLSAIQKTASALRAVDMSIIGKDGVLSVTVGDLRSETSNTYNIDIGETSETFTANFKVDNLKLMPQDYSVSLSDKKISRFKSVNGDFTVFIALESTSVFG
jgi:hypothetical protein